MKRLKLCVTPPVPHLLHHDWSDGVTVEVEADGNMYLTTAYGLDLILEPISSRRLRVRVREAK